MVHRTGSRTLSAARVRRHRAATILPRRPVSDIRSAQGWSLVELSERPIADAVKELLAVRYPTKTEDNGAVAKAGLVAIDPRSLSFL